MNKYLQIGIYRRKNDRASLVFKKKDVLYRITTTVKIKNFAGTLNQYGAAIKKNGSEIKKNSSEIKKSDSALHYVERITSPRNRQWILEIALNNGKAVLHVWEVMASGEGNLLRFYWKSSSEDLTVALNDFWVTTFFFRRR